MVWLRAGAVGVLVSASSLARIAQLHVEFSVVAQANFLRNFVKSARHDMEMRMLRVEEGFLAKMRHHVW